MRTSDQLKETTLQLPAQVHTTIHGITPVEAGESTVASYVKLGKDIETGKPIPLGDVERCGALYVVGEPRTGKTYFLISLALSDIERGHGILFIDPHTDAINDLLDRIPKERIQDVILLDPTNKTHSFGINLLRCADPTDPLELDNTYGRIRDIFVKVWGDENGHLSVWLEKILRNTVYLLLENPGYTLVDIPLLLDEDTRFRNYLLQNVKVNPFVKDFWYNEFDRLSKHDRTEQVGPALTRLDIFRTNTMIRNIVGQRKTTIDFYEILNSGNAQKIVLLRMPTRLSGDVKTMLGTIIISEMLDAAFARDQLTEADRKFFGVYCDEFQNFATPDFAKLFTQTGKFKIMPVVAHQKRVGQFKQGDPNRGATLAAAGKVLFRLAVLDSQELAPVVAKPPPTETKVKRQLVISQEPVSDLLRGATSPDIHPDIRRFVDKYLRRLQYRLEDIKEEMEGEQLIRTALLDEAALTRVDERREGIFASMAKDRDIPVSHEALERTERALVRAQEQTEKLRSLHESACRTRLTIRSLNTFLTAIMEGRFVPRSG